MSFHESGAGILWRSILTFVHLSFFLREKIFSSLKNAARNIFYSKYQSTSSSMEAIRSLSKSLKKVPKHLAISVNPDAKKDGKENIKALAKLLNWAWTANIRIVSLYDLPGFIKETKDDLERLLKQEILESNSGELSSQADSTVEIRFHIIGTIPEDKHICLEASGSGSSKTFHILVFGYEDGKPRIVKAVKNVLQNTPANQQKKITEARLDTLLDEIQLVARENCGGISMEPDLLLILGHIQSTLGFLPWHIRLTEILQVLNC